MDAVMHVMWNLFILAVEGVFLLVLLGLIACLAAVIALFLNLMKDAFF